MKLYWFIQNLASERRRLEVFGRNLNPQNTLLCVRQPKSTSWPLRHRLRHHAFKSVNLSGLPATLKKEGQSIYRKGLLSVYVTWLQASPIQQIAAIFDLLGNLVDTTKCAEFLISWSNGLVFYRLPKVACSCRQSDHLEPCAQHTKIL